MLQRSRPHSLCSKKREYMCMNRSAWFSMGSLSWWKCDISFNGISIMFNGVKQRSCTNSKRNVVDVNKAISIDFSGVKDVLKEHVQPHQQKHFMKYSSRLFCTTQLRSSNMTFKALCRIYHYPWTTVYNTCHWNKLRPALDSCQLYLWVSYIK